MDFGLISEWCLLSLFSILAILEFRMSMNKLLLLLVLLNEFAKSNAHAWTWCHFACRQSKIEIVCVFDFKFEALKGDKR